MIRENPDSRVLINLSSGTPQMKTVLAQLAVSSRHGDIRGHTGGESLRQIRKERANQRGWL